MGRPPTGRTQTAKLGVSLDLDLLERIDRDRQALPDGSLEGRSSVVRRRLRAAFTTDG